MRRIARSITLGAGLALLLGGCNLAFSDHPLFTARDGDDFGGLRPGLWRKLDPACPFDDAQPLRRWPRCAEWVFARSGALLMLGPRRKSIVSYGYVLARGAPSLLQLAVPRTAGGEPDYLYVALEPVQLDAADDVVEQREWLVECGPPPTHVVHGKAAPFVTDKPLPGLAPGANAGHPDDCMARDAGAIRAAAVASRAWAASQTWRWVRASA